MYFMETVAVVIASIFALAMTDMFMLITPLL